MKKQVELNKVIPNPNNPRIINEEKFNKLVNSIKSFPQMLEKRPLVVDENMVLLGGNMRLKALKNAGVKKVWIDIAEDWTDEQKKEFIIKDNLGYGEWDWNMIANEWDTQQLNDWGLDVWVDSDLDDFFEDEEENQEEETTTISLKYNKDDGTLVKEKLKNIDKKIEDAIWKLLEL
jgi:hypothetical protein